MMPMHPTAPKKSKVGALFPKSQESTTVSPARDRGENKAIPSTHCEAKRAASNVSTTY